MNKREKRYSALEDEKPPMMLQTTEEAKTARKAMGQPKVAVRRTTIRRGMMEAVVYPTTGAVLIKMDSGTGCALTYAESRALQSLLNEHLPDNDPTMKGEASND